MIRADSSVPSPDYLHREYVSDTYLSTFAAQNSGDLTIAFIGPSKANPNGDHDFSVALPDAFTNCYYPQNGLNLSFFLQIFSFLTVLLNFLIDHNLLQKHSQFNSPGDSLLRAALSSKILSQNLRHLAIFIGHHLPSSAASFFSLAKRLLRSKIF